MIGHGRSNPFQAWFLLPELVREKNPGNPIFFGGGLFKSGFSANIPPEMNPLI
jgi:hypothetical protein